MSANRQPDSTETSLSVFLEQGREILRTTSVRELVAQAAGLVVVDDPSFEHAGTVRSALKGAKNAAEERFERLKKPLNALTAEIRGMERDVVGPIDAATQALDGKTVAYRQEQRRLADEKRRADEAAARKIEEDRRLQEAAAAVANGTPEAEALTIMDEPLMPVLAPAAPVVPRIAGQAYVELWSAEVTDLRALIRHVAAHIENSNFLLPNMTALNQMAKASKAGLTLPGVKAVMKPQVRGRAAQ